LFPVQDEPEGQGMLMMDDQRAPFDVTFLYLKTRKQFPP
jgi:hypothetical protein